MLSLLLLLVFHGRATDPSYCLCTQAWVYDPTGQCGDSGTYGLENVCYNCPVVNATGTFNFCGSMIYAGYGSCSQPGALAARQAACVAIGGNTALTSFQCFLSTGANKSQTTGCGTAAPTTPTVTMPTTIPLASTPTTTAPTNGGVTSHHGSFALFTVLLSLYEMMFA